MNPMYYQRRDGRSMAQNGGNDQRPTAYNSQPYQSSANQGHQAAWKSSRSSSRGETQRRGNDQAYQVSSTRNRYTNNSIDTVSENHHVNANGACLRLSSQLLMSPCMQTFLSPVESFLKKRGSSLESFLQYAEINALMQTRKPSRIGRYMANPDIATPFVSKFSQPIDILFGPGSHNPGNTLLYLSALRSFRCIEQLNISQKKAAADFLVGYFEYHGTRFVEPEQCTVEWPSGDKVETHYRMVSYSRVIVRMMGIFSKVVKDAHKYMNAHKYNASNTHATKPIADAKKPLKQSESKDMSSNKGQLTKSSKLLAKTNTEKRYALSEKENVEVKQPRVNKTAENEIARKISDKPTATAQLVENTIQKRQVVSGKEKVDAHEALGKKSAQPAKNIPQSTNATKSDQPTSTQPNKEVQAVTSFNNEMKELQLAAAWVTPPLSQMVYPTKEVCSPLNPEDVELVYQTSYSYTRKMKAGIVIPRPIFFQDN